MLGGLVTVRATPGRCDSRRNRGGCDGRAIATEPDMLVVVRELEFVNMSVGRRWDGLSAWGNQCRWRYGFQSAERGQAQECARVRTMPAVILAVREGLRGSESG